MPAGTMYTTGTLDSRDIVANWRVAYNAALEGIWAPQISVLLPSNRAVEELSWIGSAPVMRKWIGGRHEEVLKKYNLSIANEPWEATLPISIDDLRRDKTGQLEQAVSDMMARTAQHWNVVAGTFITNGEAGTSGLAYDSQFFFDTDHNESGSNQTNDLTATEVPSANVTTTTTLTTTESANIIMETIAYMMGMTDDRGEPINQGGTNVTILVTKPGHYAGIRTAISLNNLGTGAGNNNPLLAWQQDFSINVQYIPQRITAADKLYFFFGNPANGSTPLIRTEEQPVTSRLIGAGSEEEFKNRRHIFGVDTVRGMGYGAWQRAALVTLS